MEIQIIFGISLRESRKANNSHNTFQSKLMLYIPETDLTNKQAFFSVVVKRYPKSRPRELERQFRNLTNEEATQGKACMR